MTSTPFREATALTANRAHGGEQEVAQEEHQQDEGDNEEGGDIEGSHSSRRQSRTPSASSRHLSMDLSSRRNSQPHGAEAV